VNTSDLPASVNRVIQPSPVPQPLSSSTFEVSRRGARSGVQQYSSMMEMFLLQRQQALEDEQRWRMEQAHIREERLAEEARLRAAEAVRREEAIAEENRRRAEDRRDLQTFMQTALTAFLAVNANRKDDNKYGNNNNDDHDRGPVN